MSEKGCLIQVIDWTVTNEIYLHLVVRITRGNDETYKQLQIVKDAPKASDAIFVEGGV
jgi:hypothetical protein